VLDFSHIGGSELNEVVAYAVDLDSLPMIAIVDADLLAGNL